VGGLAVSARMSWQASSRGRNTLGSWLAARKKETPRLDLIPLGAHDFRDVSEPFGPACSPPAGGGMTVSLVGRRGGLEYARTLTVLGSGNRIQWAAVNVKAGGAHRVRSEAPTADPEAVWLRRRRSIRPSR
jgi:hypothetical protein